MVLQTKSIRSTGKFQPGAIAAAQANYGALVQIAAQFVFGNLYARYNNGKVRASEQNHAVPRSMRVLAGRLRGALIGMPPLIPQATCTVRHGLVH